MTRNATAVLLLIFLASCKDPEQATNDAGQFVRIGVRVFGPLEGDGTVNEQFCESQRASFQFLAVPSLGPQLHEPFLVAPNQAERFDPATVIDDEDPSGTITLVQAGGCFLWHEPGVFLPREINGQVVSWDISAIRQANASGSLTEWAGLCTIEVMTDESAANRPFVGFDVVDENFPASIPPQSAGCRYEPLLGTGLTIGHSDF